MIASENEILAAGAQIIWVLEADANFQPGTAQSCRAFMNSIGSDAGVCVGDGQTMPYPGTFDVSPFSAGVGFDMIVDRRSMVVLYGHENGGAYQPALSGPEMVALVQSFTNP